ncbi:MFS transporter [Paenibacillus albiflavus]|uniref:MFS transporter n=1 Tax=Paenibacillus albiflavus TaxID=2545760 RepID=UPI0014042CDA|nr:MFS transporter [Paenibacillus albiflavus]
MNSSASPRIHFATRSLTILLVWCAIAVLCSLYAAIPLLPLIGEEFNTPLTTTAWTGTSFSIGYMIGCLFFGALSDRYGTRLIILIGMFLLAIISPLVGLSTSLLSIILMRAFQGIIAASYAPAALAYIAESYPEHSKITTLGYLSTGMLSAGVIGQLFSGAITATLHWSYVFYSLGIIYLISAMLLTWTFRQNQSIRIRLHSSSTSYSLRQQYMAVIGNRKLYPVFLITITILFAFVAMYTLLGVQLNSSTFNLSQGDILLVRGFGIVGILLSPLAGELVKRMRFTMILKMNLAISLFSAIAMGYSTGVTIVVFFSICFVAGIALTTPILVALISRLAEAGTATLAINLYSLVLFLGAALGPLAAAYSIVYVGLQLSYALLALLLSLSFITTYFVHKID